MTLKERVAQLENEIRYCRDQRGDDACWMDFERLYKLLPEGYTPPKRDTKILLSNCRKFIKSMQNPATTYVSPQRRIEELEKLNQELLLVVKEAEKALIGLIPAPDAWKQCVDIVKKCGEDLLKKPSQYKFSKKDCPHKALKKSFCGDDMCEDCGAINPGFLDP